MSRRRDPVALRLCVMLLRVCAALVPASLRADWRAEWEAEIRHRWRHLERRDGLTWRARMNLVRRVLGALPDAAWLRRQFTLDADAVHDLRHGVRMLRKSPAFTLAAVTILAVGIAGTVSIVTLLDTLLFRPLPYVDSDRIVTIWQRSAGSRRNDDVAPANFLDWRDRSRSFVALAAVIPYSHDYTGGGEPEVFFGAQVTEGFWDAIGTYPALGRAFRPEEHLRGASRVVILSYGLWQRRFGGRPDIVNSAISLDGEPWTVIGVLPRGFSPQLLPRPGELGIWTPKVMQDYERQTRASAWWNVVARLAPGVTREQAQSEMTAISIALQREYPRENEGMTAVVVPLREHLMGDVRLPLSVMLVAVVLVLLIGCANVASLLLARGMAREREFAIRAALGAGRGRLVRQLAVESLLLSALSALAGIALASTIVRGIVALAPAGVLRLQEASIDRRMLIFAAALTTMTAVAFGLIPALQFSRRSGAAMRDRHAAPPRAGFRRALVATEVALALVLLTGAGLLIRSFERLMAVDPGFSARNVVALQVFAWDRNTTADRMRAFFDNTLDRLRALPGVHAAGAVSAMPFMLANIDIKSGLEIVGRTDAKEAERKGVFVTVATPGYFQALAIPLREGRYLEAHDTERSPFVAVISESLRRREWPRESPLGKRVAVRMQGQRHEAEIVGVVKEIRHDGLDRAPRPEVFLPLRQMPIGSMTYVLRASGDPGLLVDAAKRAVWAVDPMQTFYDVAYVERMIAGSVVRQRFSMAVMSAFAIVALILCTTGLYALISFTTAQRTREIGVRMALGADGGTIRRMVLREGLAIVSLGVASGLAGSAIAGRAIQNLLFDIKPDDPVTFALVAALLGAVALAACYVPARRATRVDPLVALRVE